MSSLDDLQHEPQTVASETTKAGVSVRGVTPERLVVVIPLVLLLLGVANHYRLQLTADLTQWKGGGFGMFASTDSVGSRYYKAYLVTDNGVEPITVPGRILAGTNGRGCQSYPRLAILQRIAGELVKLDWYRDVEVRPVPSSVYTRNQYPELVQAVNRPRIVRSISPTVDPDWFYEAIAVRSVRLELWTLQRSRESRHVTERLLMACSVRVDRTVEESRL